MRTAIQKEDYTRVIYDKGCLRAGEEWVERNLVPVAGVAVAISVLQVGARVLWSSWLSLFCGLFAVFAVFALRDQDCLCRC